MNACEDTHGHVICRRVNTLDYCDIDINLDFEEAYRKAFTEVMIKEMNNLIDGFMWPDCGHSHEPRAYGDLLIGQCPVCNTGLSTTGWCCKCNMFPQREVTP